MHVLQLFLKVKQVKKILQKDNVILEVAYIADDVFCFIDFFPYYFTINIMFNYYSFIIKVHSYCFWLKKFRQISGSANEKNVRREFPGGPVVRTSHFDC